MPTAARSGTGVSTCAALLSLADQAVASPRLLAVFAHPDDEVLAVGGRLELLSSSRFVCVTDGVPRDGQDARAHGFATLAAYRDARHQELLSAFAAAGLDGLSCSRTLKRCGVTQFISDQTAGLHLPELSRLLAAEIESYRPEAILTHPYEGGHPDHDATAFSTHAAVRLLDGAVPIIEAPFYHAGPHGIETGTFLPGGPPALVGDLSADQRARKAERLACFTSQQETLQQFSTATEQYRVAPVYDFTQPPHPGPLFYDGFPWGMSGARFCELARAAFLELGL